MRALLRRLTGRDRLQIIDAAWDARSAGQLTALFDGRPAAHLMTWTSSDAPENDQAPIGLSGPLYVEFGDCCTVPEFWPIGVTVIIVPIDPAALIDKSVRPFFVGAPHLSGDLIMNAGHKREGDGGIGYGLKCLAASEKPRYHARLKKPLIEPIDKDLDRGLVGDLLKKIARDNHGHHAIIVRFTAPKR